MPRRTQTLTLLTTNPGFVNKFIMASVILLENGQQKQESVFLASIDWLIQHEHKAWFGDNSIQVWRKFIPSMGYNFIPVTNILCRCAYVNDSVKFNQIHEETVTIVILLNNFAGL